MVDETLKNGDLQLATLTDHFSWFVAHAPLRSAKWGILIRSGGLGQYFFETFC